MKSISFIFLDCPPPSLSEMLLTIKNYTISTHFLLSFYLILLYIKSIIFSPIFYLFPMFSTFTYAPSINFLLFIIFLSISNLVLFFLIVYFSDSLPPSVHMFSIVFHVNHLKKNMLLSIFIITRLIHFLNNYFSIEYPKLPFP